ncbi:hypothetical protein [Acidicapsa acidisoli]|uniref:hypothetical protein n=1 Tax=Acidicapsa acidisoli TaxID=1615681 RepID=UPI0021E0C567|nr:hypothetical protein [Acidicapsa acidisoli]
MPKDNVTLPMQVPNTKQLITTTTVDYRTAQKAVLFNSSGEITASVSLPFFPNLFGPLVPDWFYSKAPTVSLDGQIAAIGRTRVAWVLVDTDRDWGSEIDILNLDPLHLITTLKTGQRGIQAVAVDHRNHTIRLVGFWRNQWHDLSWDESHPGKWESSKIQ